MTTPSDSGDSPHAPWGRLAARAEVAARQWEAAGRATTALHRASCVEELAWETLRLAAELTGAAAGSLLLRDAAEERLVYTAVVGPWAAALLGQSAPIDRGVAGSVLREGAGRVTLDLRPARPSRGGRRAAAGSRPTMLTAPLITPQGRGIGVLQLLERQEGVFDADDLAVVGVVAALAAAAIDTAWRRESSDGDPAARERQARLQQELAIGRRIQMSLLPPPRLSLPGFEVVSRCEPATEVGGDFYDLFSVELPETESECWGIVLGDVSGKGIPAALFMAVATTLLRAEARRSSSPAAALAAAGAELHPRMRPPGRSSAGGSTSAQGAPFFATAACGLLDTARREICLASAGQTPPIHWPAGGPPRYLRVRGLPLGVRPTARYEEIGLSLAPGDRLLFCSDGFVEAREDGSGPGAPVVGYAGLLRRLEAMGERQGLDLLAALFAAETSPEDDRTAVLLTAVA